MRDSAGVELLDFGSLPDSIVGWSVEQAPELSIGSAEGVGAAAFGRVTSVAVAESGLVVVADRLSGELRAFGPDGAHRWTSGRPGEGPGEFSELSIVGVFRGDSIAAFDARDRTVSVFGPSGEFVGDHRVEVPPGVGGIRDARITRNGGMVGLGLEDLEDGIADGGYMLMVVPLFFDRGGALIARGGASSGGDYFSTALGDGSAYMSFALPIARSTQIAAAETSVAVTTQETFEVRVYSETGRLLRVLRVGASPAVIDREAYGAAGLPGSADLLRDTLPAVNRIGIDATGLLWVEEYVPPYESRGAHWWVFDVGPGRIARLDLPQGFAPHHFGPDHVVGLTEDSLGVQYLQRYRIVVEGSRACTAADPSCN